MDAAEAMSPTEKSLLAPRKEEMKEDKRKMERKMERNEDGEE